MPYKIISIALLVAAIFALVCENTDAAMILLDRVAVVNQPVQLAVRTSGRLMPKGGQLVVLSVEGTRLKQILTGGDGYGYLMHTPAETGIKTITAVHEDQSESALLLVLPTHARVILIDMETALRESAIAPRLREGSRQALASLNRKHPIIYLYTLTGQSLNRRWLKSHELPASAILPWRNGAALRTLGRLGIGIHAIVGSAGQLKLTDNSIAHRFSFEDSPAGLPAESWADVLEALGVTDTPDQQ